MKRINVFLNQRRLNIVLVSLCNTKFTKITIKGDCKPTFICDEFISQFTRHELVCSNLFSRSRCRLPRKEYKKDIWELVQCKKNSWREGSHEPFKNVSIKSWFTLIYPKMVEGRRGESLVYRSGEFLDCSQINLFLKDNNFQITKGGSINFKEKISKQYFFGIHHFICTWKTQYNYIIII